MNGWSDVAVVAILAVVFTVLGGIMLTGRWPQEWRLIYVVAEGGRCRVWGWHV